MKLKIMLLSLVFVLGLSLLMTPSIKVNAESIENYEPVLEFYDENNERIYPYSEEELRSIQNILEQDWTIYTFGETQITNTVLIRQGFNFFNPGTILLNTSGTANSVRVEAYYPGTTDLAGSVNVPGGWTGGIHVPLTFLDRGQSYYLQLRNNDPGTAHFDGGQVWYDG
ncbi:hypothetical protein [Virgibacillus kimchii]